MASPSAVVLGEVGVVVVADHVEEDSALLALSLPKSVTS